MEEKILELGERRIVTLKLWLKDGTNFTPTDCRWDLTLERDDPESGGEIIAENDGIYWILNAEIQPNHRGAYRLTYTFTVGTEILKKSLRVKVI